MHCPASKTRDKGNIKYPLLIKVSLMLGSQEEAICGAQRRPALMWCLCTAFAGGPL